MTAYTAIGHVHGFRHTKKGQPGEQERLSDAERLERAVTMVERFHRMYLRTLQALRDLRRRAALVVRSSAQVNITQQQVNVAGG